MSIVRDIVLRIRVDAPGIAGAGAAAGAPGIAGAAFGPPPFRGGGVGGTSLVGPGGISGVGGRGAVAGLSARGGGAESLKRFRDVASALDDIEKRFGRSTASAYRFAHALGAVGFEAARLLTWSRLITRVTYGAQELGLGGTALLGGGAAIGGAVGLGIVGATELLRGNTQFGRARSRGGQGVLQGPTIEALRQPNAFRTIGAEWSRQIAGLTTGAFNVFRSGNFTQPSIGEDILVESGLLSRRGLSGFDAEAERARTLIGLQGRERLRTQAFGRGGRMAQQFMAPLESQLGLQLGRADIAGASQLPALQQFIGQLQERRAGIRGQLGGTFDPGTANEARGQISEITQRLIAAQQDLADQRQREAIDAEQSLRRRLQIVQQIEATERQRITAGVSRGFALPAAAQRVLAESAQAVEGGGATRRQLMMLQMLGAPVTPGQSEQMQAQMLGFLRPEFVQAFDLGGREADRLRQEGQGFMNMLRGLMNVFRQQQGETIQAVANEQEAASEMDRNVNDIARERALEQAHEGGR